jgi:serine phosphatase RsbU (regulator of sigma subunit)
MNAKPRVLIVDDTPLNIKILVDLLRNSYTLSVATSGKAALEIAFSEHRPDIVLLDVMMPEMDGYEVCRQLKADARTRDIPVIFVTAMHETEDETKGFALGAVDYITKPIKPAIVLARVAAHLELAMSRKMLAQRNRELQDALKMAGDVQRCLLPKAAPQLPGLDIAGTVIPCDAVGGDYLDYLTNSEFAGRGLGLVVGDIAGHGPASALLMAAVRASLRMRASQPGSLGDIVTELNRSLAADVGGTWRFMTMFLIALNDQTLTYVGAGHDSPLIIKADGSVQLVEGHGIPLGMVASETYTQEQAAFAGAGSVLVISTDGVAESFNDAGEQYGTDRLRDVLLKNRALDANHILSAVLDDVARFRGQRQQVDDLTLMIVKRTA